MSGQGRWHWHPCEGCGNAYSCGPCPGKDVNGRCHGCRTEHERPLWDRNHDPVACCRSQARLLTKKEVTSLGNLAGTKPWYRCRKCARCAPYDPTRPEEKT